MQTDIDKR